MADVVRVVNGGLGIVTSRIKGNGAAEPNLIRWGTGGGTAAAVTNTSLETVSAETTVTGTSSLVTTTVENDTYQVVGTMTSESEQTINEVGLFSSTTLFLRGTFSGIALNTDDSIEFTIKTAVSDGSA